MFDDLANSEGKLVITQWIAEKKGLAEPEEHDDERSNFDAPYDNDDIPF